MNRVITEAFRNQFDSTFHMARILVKVCPEKVWAGTYNEVPFWQQVFHYVYYIDFWMREKFDDREWRTMIFEDAYTTDLYAKSYEGLFISQEKMLAYLDAIQAKTTCLFDALNDEKLGTSVFGDNPQFTYADVITGQIRHIMYNLGYLNGILRELGLPESDWYAYNEPEGA
ncbi:hypothetical protein QA584_04710 [Anaerocolumna sp. AGMB13025]|uniref:DinB family protein n=1 Tax=Anaerocolumna sp. AGMB13025 TaxID=3039116 RepID=UPI00241CE12B|nr:DinB family protein [Anaerocolumna sp. AGMB13025]WFR58375.1 hypothetical protein QA584_04710 [Anaerocolumna sp. AGMB13025]